MAAPTRLLPFLALGALLPAQGSFDLDKATNGAIGRTLTFDFANAPAQRTMLFTLATTPGPIPLSLLDPRDTRSMAVGFDLSFFWFSAPTGAGTGQVGIPIPNVATLAGRALRFQALTFPGTTLFAGALSNLAVQQLGTVDTATTLPATLATGRAIAATFASGRDLVVAGGGQGSLLGAVGLASSEVLDGRTLETRAGPTLVTARALASSVTLQDGRVLLIGGVDATGAVLASAEIYDPATGLFTATGSMANPRVTHEAELLADGRVMVTGGTTTLADAVAALAGSLAATEIWNPATGAFSGARAMPARLLAPDLTRLADGRVLQSGGFQVNVVLGFPIPVGSVTTARVYDPASNTWSNVGAMRQSRGAHGPTSVRLQDGRVLVTGGAQAGIDLTQAAAIADAETFDPATGQWTAMPPMAVNRALHTATLLADGRVLVAGGADGTIAAPLELASVQVFAPATNTWTSLPPLVTARGAHGAAQTADGLVVLFGGQGGGGSATLASIETIRP